MREEGVHYCRVAHKEVTNFPKCLERPRRSSLLTVHRFCLAMVFFFFSFSFVWLYDVKMLFLSHVSHLVCVCYHGVRARMCVFSRIFSAPAQVTSCMVCMGVCVCVCVRACIHLPTSWSVFCFHYAVDTLYG